MTKEAYVSLEVARLLKEKGFKEWCNYGYGTAVRHNGEDIDEDEEYELESEGRGDEIEYIEGGLLYHMNCNNKDCLESLFACPTHQMAMRWLREKKYILIFIVPAKDESGNLQYMADVLTWNEDEGLYESTWCTADYVYEKTVEAALKYALENLI